MQSEIANNLRSYYSQWELSFCARRVLGSMRIFVLKQCISEGFQLRYVLESYESDFQSRDGICWHKEITSVNCLYYSLNKQLKLGTIRFLLSSKLANIHNNNRTGPYKNIFNFSKYENPIIPIPGINYQTITPTFETIVKQKVHNRTNTCKGKYQLIIAVWYLLILSISITILDSIADSTEEYSSIMKFLKASISVLVYRITWRYGGNIESNTEPASVVVRVFKRRWNIRSV